MTRQPPPLTLLLQPPPQMLLQPPLQTPLLQLPPQMPLLQPLQAPLLQPPSQMPLLPPQQQLLQLWPYRSLRIRPLRFHPRQEVTRRLLLQPPPLMLLLPPPPQTPLQPPPPQTPLLQPQQQLLQLWPCRSLQIRPLRCHLRQEVTRQLLLQRSWRLLRRHPLHRRPRPWWRLTLLRSHPLHWPRMPRLHLWQRPNGRLLLQSKSSARPPSRRQPRSRRQPTRSDDAAVRL